jgi:hypothetical protein
LMNCRAEVQALLRKLNAITTKIDDLADLNPRRTSSPWGS